MRFCKKSIIILLVSSFILGVIHERIQNEFYMTDAIFIFSLFSPGIITGIILLLLNYLPIKKRMYVFFISEIIFGLSYFIIGMSGVGMDGYGGEILFLMMAVAMIVYIPFALYISKSIRII